MICHELDFIKQSVTRGQDLFLVKNDILKNKMTIWAIQDLIQQSVIGEVGIFFPVIDDLAGHCIIR